MTSAGGPSVPSENRSQDLFYQSRESTPAFDSDSEGTEWVVNALDGSLPSLKVAAQLPGPPASTQQSHTSSTPRALPTLASHREKVLSNTQSTRPAPYKDFKRRVRDTVLPSSSLVDSLTFSSTTPAGPFGSQLSVTQGGHPGPQSQSHPPSDMVVPTPDPPLNLSNVPGGSSPSTILADTSVPSPQERQGGHPQPPSHSSNPSHLQPLGDVTMQTDSHDPLPGLDHVPTAPTPDSSCNFVGLSTNHAPQPYTVSHLNLQPEPLARVRDLMLHAEPVFLKATDQSMSSSGSTSSSTEMHPTSSPLPALRQPILPPSTPNHSEFTSTPTTGNTIAYVVSIFNRIAENLTDYAKSNPEHGLAPSVAAVCTHAAVSAPVPPHSHICCHTQPTKVDKEKGKEKDTKTEDIDMDADDEGSGDEGEYIPLRLDGRRKVVRKTTKQKDARVILLNKTFREYLKDKGVFPKNKSAELKSVSQETVDSFIANGNPIPDVQAPEIQWGAGWKTPWNSCVRDILIDDFLQNVKDRKVKYLKYEEDLMSPSKMRRLLSTKLNAHTSKYKLIEQAKLSERDAEESRKRLLARESQNRRGGRRHGTFARRVAVVKNHVEVSPEWAQASMVLETLGAGGMSSDETETETKDEKRLRRIAIQWISPDISELFRAIDSYYKDPLGGFPDMKASDKRGNRPYFREYDAFRTNNTRQVMQGLPVNYYRRDWWVKLPRHQQNNLLPKSEVLIPHLDLYEPSSM